jgi:hypothetical protein
LREPVDGVLPVDGRHPDPVDGWLPVDGRVPVEGLVLVDG